MALGLFARRTFIWRCVVVSFLIYVLSIGAFIPLLSSTPKIRLDLSDPSTVSEPPAAVTRNHSATVLVPTAAVVDGRRPLDAAAAAVAVADAAVSTKPTKKPTALESLHKNMTLHKANMSDLLKHVKAAVANRSDNASLGNRKVNSAPVDVQVNDAGQQHLRRRRCGLFVISVPTWLGKCKGRDGCTLPPHAPISKH